MMKNIKWCSCFRVEDVDDTLLASADYNFFVFSKNNLLGVMITFSSGWIGSNEGSVGVQAIKFELSAGIEKKKTLEFVCIAVSTEFEVRRLK